VKRKENPIHVSDCIDVPLKNAVALSCCTFTCTGFGCKSGNLKTLAQSNPVNPLWMWTSLLEFSVRILLNVHMPTCVLGLHSKDAGRNIFADYGNTVKAFGALQAAPAAGSRSCEGAMTCIDVLLKNWLRAEERASIACIWRLKKRSD
jgi:hypothetical protein